MRCRDEAKTTGEKNLENLLETLIKKNNLNNWLVGWLVCYKGKKSEQKVVVYQNFISSINRFGYFPQKKNKKGQYLNEQVQKDNYFFQKFLTQEDECLIIKYCNPESILRWLLPFVINAFIISVVIDCLIRAAIRSINSGQDRLTIIHITFPSKGGASQIPHQDRNPPENTLK